MHYAFWPLVLGIALFSLSGCHRQHYRLQADQEAHLLIEEKGNHIARSPNTALRIDIDQRSRMFNPFDLDFQPMPVDDPASHRYMQCVDGRRGYPMWEAAGVTNAVENPGWWEHLPLNDEGILVLDADTAVQLALLHSPDYQRQLEQLYLAALDVSSERFQFDTQFFGGLGASGTVRGNGDSSVSLGNNNLRMQRFFGTGADLVVGLANQITWQLSGPNTQSATTILDFSLIQPLLRGAGRDRVMERLTLSERRLLANVRAFERYRRSFYLNITIGRGIESTVQRSGGVFGVGLGGFTGLGGGFAGLGGGGGGGGGGFGTGGGVPDAGGFLGLQQDQLQIRNLEENIARLSENLLVLESTLIELLTTIPEDPEAIVRQRLQVAQARSALLGQQNALVARQTGFQASLDAFLGDLGLPPYLCVEIDDPMLNRFELIDRELRTRREELIRVRTEVGAYNVRLLEEGEAIIDPDTGLPESTLKWNENVAQAVGDLQKTINPLREFLTKLTEVDAPKIDSDIEKLSESIPERKARNKRLRKLYALEKENKCTLLNLTEVDESVFDISELDELQPELRADFDALLKRLEQHTERLAELRENLETFAKEGAGDATEADTAKAVREKLVLASQDLLSDLADDVLAMQLIQARARTESVVLPEVDLVPHAAFEIARTHRRDWANARASLVDAWRLIEFNADNLESSLDLTFDGGISNDGNNPFALRGDTASLRVGLQWDAPITRLQERNTYRQSLIEFEQARRSYYAFEDGIWRLVRGQIRQLQSNQLTFELQRESVRIAAMQIELNEDIRILRDARGLNSGPTAARDTISAFNDLLTAQNALLNVYVNYEVIRRGLDFDLGTMQLTPEGMWIDPGPISAEMLIGLPGTTDASAMLEGECTNCGIRLRTPPQEPSYMPMSMIDEQEVIIAPAPTLGDLIDSEAPLETTQQM
ncbi:hypothetical protein [Stieleria varia]|uniref:hypothetical protein n=1 Tax=Stieleria varia TaxID=2528005 RepID=UPI0011B72E29|nr:hypothetical protein [Stieleria varia]